MVLISTTEYIDLLRLKLSILWDACMEDPNNLALELEYERIVKIHNYYLIKMRSTQTLTQELAIETTNPHLN